MVSWKHNLRNFISKWLHFMPWAPSPEETCYLENSFSVTHLLLFSEAPHSKLLSTEGVTNIPSLYLISWSNSPCWKPLPYCGFQCKLAGMSGTRIFRRLAQRPRPMSNLNNSINLSSTLEVFQLHREEHPGEVGSRGFNCTEK